MRGQDLDGGGQSPDRGSLLSPNWAKPCQLCQPPWENRGGGNWQNAKSSQTAQMNVIGEKIKRGCHDITQITRGAQGLI